MWPALPHRQIQLSILVPELMPYRSTCNLHPLRGGAGGGGGTFEATMGAASLPSWELTWLQITPDGGTYVVRAGVVASSLGSMTI